MITTERAPAITVTHEEHVTIQVVSGGPGTVSDMDIKSKITAMNRDLLVTRYGYSPAYVARLKDNQASAIRVRLHAEDEHKGITYCGWCGKRSHGYCD